ncbi:MAG: pilin [Candidatus Moraniibacteriota bacterium]
MKKYFFLIFSLLFLGTTQVFAGYAENPEYGKACAGVGFGTMIPANGNCIPTEICRDQSLIAPVTSGTNCSYAAGGTCCSRTDIVPPAGRACLAPSTCRSVCRTDETPDAVNQCPVGGRTTQVCCIPPASNGGTISEANCIALNPAASCVASDPSTATRTFVDKGACIINNVTSTKHCWQAPPSSDEGDGAPTGVKIPTSGETGLSDKPVSEILTNFALNLLELLGIFAVIAFVVSGFQYFLANGDPKEVEKAKANAKYSIYGIIVALAGVIIVNAVDAILNANF